MSSTVEAPIIPNELNMRSNLTERVPGEFSVVFVAVPRLVLNPFRGFTPAKPPMRLFPFRKVHEMVVCMQLKGDKYSFGLFLPIM